MPEETTLEAFAGTGEAGTAAPRPTLEYRPEGVACERCGETGPLRWASDDGMVCPTCMEW